MNREKQFWEKEYENNLRIWGDRPSELAVIAVRYLKSHMPAEKYPDVLDIDGKYDIVFASNLYQILQKNQREYLRKKIAHILKPRRLKMISGSCLLKNSTNTGMMNPGKAGKRITTFHGYL